MGLGDVIGDSGTRMHEQWRFAMLQAREHRAQRSDCSTPPSAPGGQRDPDAAALERAVDVVGVGAVERDRAPHAEGSPERERALVVGVEQRRVPARRGKPLDAERARQAEQRPVEPVELHERARAAPAPRSAWSIT